MPGPNICFKNLAHSDPLQMFKIFKKLYLTASFKFGKEIPSLLTMVYVIASFQVQLTLT